MLSTTNKLVEISRPAAVSSLSLAAVVLAAGLYLHHGTDVHASSAAPPLDDSSVSSLVALDGAVEAVASRVSPAVVNVAVSARGGSHEAAEEGQSEEGQGEEGQNDGAQGQGAQLPPGLEQFFGHGSPRMAQPQPQGIERGIGSGVILSPDGYIVTNNHVVEGAIHIKVTLNDRRVLNARVIGTDKLTDLAVIKVDATNLPSIPWGDSATLKPGQTVLAFGSPFGYFQNSVTRGIVSAVNRQNPYSNDARKPGGFIQTDAAINPGNSGGALVNAHGQLIGINAWILSSTGSFSGAGFAIPAQIAQSVTSQLIRNGVVHHGYLGISMNDVTPDNAAFFKLPDATERDRRAGKPELARKPRRPCGRRCDYVAERPQGAEQQRPAGGGCGGFTGADRNARRPAQWFKPERQPDRRRVPPRSPAGGQRWRFQCR